MWVTGPKWRSKQVPVQYTPLSHTPKFSPQTKSRTFVSISKLHEKTCNIRSILDHPKRSCMCTSNIAPWNYSLEVESAFAMTQRNEGCLRLREEPLSSIIATPHAELGKGTTRGAVMTKLSPSLIPRLGTSPTQWTFQQYLEEVGHTTVLNVQDTWLPLTESRNGNMVYAAFHNLNAMIGYQAIFLPFAFMYLGWAWGLSVLSVAFVWQMYTKWQLIMMHETEPGKRIRSYIELSQEAFGPAMGLSLTLPAILNLTIGTSIGLVVVGGGALELFYTSVCARCADTTMTMIEWCVVFAALCLILAQLPNMHSIAGVSLAGAVMAVAYTTLIWVISVSKKRPRDVSYALATEHDSPLVTTIAVLIAIGIIAFAFRGHNLVLEIQGTLPSTLKQPSSVSMWSGAKVAYLALGVCYFPLAAGGYQGFGNKILESGVLYSLHAADLSSSARALLALTFLFVMCSCLSSFQVFSMPVFDMMEQLYTRKRHRGCTPAERLLSRTLYVLVVLFVAVAFPFLTTMAGLIGGLSAIPVTFVVPCFMWLKIRRPVRWSFTWCLNWFLAVFGMVLTGLVTAAGVAIIVQRGIKFDFFKPHS